MYLEVAVLEHEGADEATTGGDERAVERRRTSSVRAAQGHLRTDHKKHEKLTIFRLFWFATFHFHFFLHFFIQCLELIKIVF